MLRCFNFEPSFIVRWCRARDLFRPQIPVTAGRFELGSKLKYLKTQISYCCKVVNSGTQNPPNLLGLMA